MAEYTIRYAYGTWGQRLVRPLGCPNLASSQHHDHSCTGPCSTTCNAWSFTESQERPANNADGCASCGQSDCDSDSIYLRLISDTLRYKLRVARACLTAKLRDEVLARLLGTTHTDVRVTVQSARRVSGPGSRSFIAFAVRRLKSGCSGVAPEWVVWVARRAGRPAFLGCAAMCVLTSKLAGLGRTGWQMRVKLLLLGNSADDVTTPRSQQHPTLLRAVV